MNQVILTMENIRKSFDSSEVLKGVSLNLYAGESMALMGENGAGKSTLMKILVGIEPPDSGNISLFKEPYFPAGVLDTESKGIVMIHQELNLFDEMTVLDNVFLGSEIMRDTFNINYTKQKEELITIFDKLNIHINPNIYVKDLSIGQKQLIEIAKALRKNAKILIMDEPTSALNEEEVAHIFEVILALKERGVAIVYISHRMQEIYSICEKVTVLRDGEFIGEHKLPELSSDQLIELMVGRDVPSLPPNLDVSDQAQILSVENICDDFVKNVSFTLNKGEVLGIGGLMGSGRTSLARLLYGFMPIKSGSISLDGKPIKLSHPRDALKHQIVYVSEDRKGDGLWLNFSIKYNISISSLNLFVNSIGQINTKKEDLVTKKFKELTKVKGMAYNVGSLSGGNQQKVAIARGLLLAPKILILDEPTRGIDIGARGEIYTLINEFKSKGTAVILISSDMPELLSLSGRVLVMSEGKMKGILEPNEKSPENVIRLAVNLGGE